jgi:hypothetical protein
LSYRKKSNYVGANPALPQKYVKGEQLIMAVKKTEQPVKLTAAQAREKVKELEEKIEKYDSTAFCLMCKKHKNRETHFYVNTDPMYGETTCTPICRECARKIALRVDKNGEEHEPTKESVILALKYLQKPFLNTVWNASVQESENLIAGKVKHNAWSAYIKNIQMVNYLGLTFFDSDFYKEKIVYDDEKTEVNIINEHLGQDVYEDCQKNKEDVKRLLNYDPFEQEAIEDQPFLYSQLLGLLDSSEDANDDMMRTSSAISIVRGFLQQSKIDDTVAKLMSDINNIEKNSATIKTLQDSKSKITSIITNLAQDSCISLKYNKNAKKGENTWTGKLKKIKDLNLREGEVNGFDMETCRAMSQVMDLSHSSILKMLSMDESEWSDMVAEQRKTIVQLQDDLNKYIEISRILLRENLDIKDYLSEHNIKLEMDMVDLNQLYSCFSTTKDKSEEEGDTDEI